MPSGRCVTVAPTVRHNYTPILLALCASSKAQKVCALSYLKKWNCRSDTWMSRFSDLSRYVDHSAISACDITQHGRISLRKKNNPSKHSLSRHIHYITITASWPLQKLHNSRLVVTRQPEALFYCVHDPMPRWWVYLASQVNRGLLCFDSLL